MGVGRERGEGVDLLGDAHGADLGGHGRTDAARHHERGQHGPELARQRHDDDVGDGRFGGEAGEAGVALQRQHHAGEDGGEADHGQRVVADLQHLADDLLAVPRRRERAADGLQGEGADRADRLQEGERHAPEQGDQRDAHGDVSGAISGSLSG